MESEKTVDKKPKKLPVQIANQKLHNNKKYLKITRYIPSVVKHHVWMRDQGQCTYVYRRYATRGARPARLQ